MTSRPKYNQYLTSNRRQVPAGKVIKHFSCSAQLKLKFILLINVKMPTIMINVEMPTIVGTLMPTIVGILTFISTINYRLQSSKPSISIYLDYFGIYEQFQFHAPLI